MKERPLLFGAPMVQALLSKTKTQTRRTKGLDIVNKDPDSWHSATIVSGSDDKILAAFRGKNNPLIVASAIACPFGKIGDRLWVRETWSYKGWSEEKLVSPVYKADGSDPFDKWSPSIHMPWAVSRITLEITDIGIERLQSITPADAIAEGIKAHQPWPEVPDVPRYQLYGPIYENSDEELGYETISDPVFSFFTLWTTINGDDSIIKNPWVWVVKFKYSDNS